MLEKLNTNFWFWIALAFINLFLLFGALDTDGDKFSCTLSLCMLFFSFGKALKVASDTDRKEK